MLKEQRSYNLVQNMGHKGPVLRLRCIGPRRARTQILFYSKVAILCVARNELHFSFIVIRMFLQCYSDYIGCFFSCLTYKRQPGALVVFIRLSKGFYNCRRLLYLPETRRTTQRWQSFGQSVGPVLISQARKKTLYAYRNKVPGVKHV